MSPILSYCIITILQSVLCPEHTQTAIVFLNPHSMPPYTHGFRFLKYLNEKLFPANTHTQFPTDPHSYPRRCELTPSPHTTAPHPTPHKIPLQPP